MLLRGPFHTSILFLSLTVLASEKGAFSPELAAAWVVKRESVYEFTQPPQVLRQGDEVEIRFASKAWCDATVVIEDAQGKIVRHLASGLLGPHAPAPFQSGSLSQRLVWDGKNDFGRFMDDEENLTVRVGLGLRAKFEKNLYYHPNRRTADWYEIKAAEDGVYVYSYNTVDYLRHYDHDGNYVKTIYPFAADKLKDVKGLEYLDVPGAGKLPHKHGEYHSSLLPKQAGLFDTQPPVSAMAIHGKHIALLGNPRLIRLATDGATGGLEIAGPQCRPQMSEMGRSDLSANAQSAAFSPDGKWLYLATFRYHFDKRVGDRSGHAVYRMPFNGEQEPKLFIGLDSPGSKADDQFKDVGGIDVDKNGRIYVADWCNDRVQVFTSNGTFFKSIKVKAPVKVLVHKRTQEIYVFSWQLYGVWWPTNHKGMKEFNSRGTDTVSKFAPLEDPKLLMDAPLPKGFCQGFMSRVELDSWSSQPRFWIYKSDAFYRTSGIQIWEARDGKVVKIRDFEQDSEKAGVPNRKPWFQKQFLFFDPVRNKLYCGEPDCSEMKLFGNAVAIDPDTGACKMHRLPGEAAAAGFDARGYCYLRIGDAIQRYEPEIWREVPYDYGEERKHAASALSTPGGGGSSYKFGDMAVSPTGEVAVSCCFGAKSSDRANAEKTASDGATRWSAQLYPGRPGGMYVHVYDRHGEVRHEDVVKGIGLVTGGLAMDWQGNLFAGIRAPRAEGGTAVGFHNGTLAKFGPGEGVFRTSHPKEALVALEEPPQRPKDVQGMWVDGAKWFYPAGSVGSTGHCWCRHGHFALDYLGRSFVPEPWRYAVSVLDANGNVIARFGRYGNADSAGPQSPVPLGGDEIGLCDAHYVAAHTDRRLFIADVGNARIVSAKLDYHATQSVPLKDAKKAP